MNAKPEITDGEIQSYMDFDKLLKQRTEALALSRRRLIKHVMLGTLSGVALLAVWLFYQPSEKPISAGKAGSELPKKVQVPLEAKKDSLLSSGASPSEKEQDHASKPALPIEKKTTSPAGTKMETPEKEDSNTVKTNAGIRAMSVYAHAEPDDGYPALYAYFNETLTYPPAAVADSIEGVVTVVFSINTEGRPEKIYIDQSLGEPFDREAIRVIQNMPLWKPATYDGKPVSSKMSLPLTFQIKKIKTQ